VIGKHVLPAALAAGLFFALAACDGPAVPSTVTGEPNCETFQLGPVKMKAGLKHPVRLRVLSGEEVIATVMVNGVPKGSQPTRFLLPDTNAEYTLEWTQCASEHAPSEATESGPQRGDPTSHYECGADSKPYATAKHTTKRGDSATHTIPMEPPPDTTCWEGGGTNAAPSASASASASAAPAVDSAAATAEVAPTASASAEPAASASAAPSPSAEPAPSPSAAPSASPAAAPSASAAKKTPAP
jgi:hypothetical protein